MEKAMLVSVLLGVVLVASLFQAMQLSQLSGKVAEVSAKIKGIKAVPVSTQASVQQYSAPAPQPQQPPGGGAAIPNQVGGC